jgi:1-acyl-sn-glycerol-3-phosphate acyltransferase
MDPLFGSVAGTLKAWIKVMGWQMLVTGEEHIPEEGPAVLAANHISYLDPITVGYAADMRGRAVRYLAKQELFDKPVFGGLLRKLKQVPVDRHGAPGRALEVAAETLRSGELIVNFPEATISTAFVPFEGKTRLTEAPDRLLQTFQQDGCIPNGEPGVCGNDDAPENSAGRRRRLLREQARSGACKQDDAERRCALIPTVPPREMLSRSPTAASITIMLLFP